MFYITKKYEHTSEANVKSTSAATRRLQWTKSSVPRYQIAVTKITTISFKNFGYDILTQYTLCWYIFVRVSNTLYLSFEVEDFIVTIYSRDPHQYNR